MEASPAYKSLEFARLTFWRLDGFLDGTLKIFPEMLFIDENSCRKILMPFTAITEAQQNCFAIRSFFRFDIYVVHNPSSKWVAPILFITVQNYSDVLQIPEKHSIEQH
jgi:hypothetical protein